jgi:hypothetical protein
MTVRKYTYAELANAVHVTRCRGIHPRTGATCFEDHQRGSFTADDQLVHWADRERVTKAGIRTFLGLAAMTNPVVANSTPGWEQIYIRNMWVSAMARVLLIRLPAALANLDRAKVRAAIVDLPTNTPLRPEAMKWSQR